MERSLCVSIYSVAPATNEITLCCSQEAKCLGSTPSTLLIQLSIASLCREDRRQHKTQLSLVTWPVQFVCRAVYMPKWETTDIRRLQNLEEDWMELRGWRRKDCFADKRSPFYTSGKFSPAQCCKHIMRESHIGVQTYHIIPINNCIKTLRIKVLS